MENDVKSFTDHFDSFADGAETTIDDACRSRDYFDGRQLTPKEYSTLKSRGQPPLVRNVIQRSIMKIQGVETQLRSDPKAYPRTPDDEDGAEVITKALRFVADTVDLDEKSSDQFEYQIVEGYGGGIVEYNPKKERIELTIIHPDRLYWDVHSRKNDYSDAAFTGFVTWMDYEAAKLRWPKKAKDIQGHYDSLAPHQSFEDQPDNLRWVNFKRKRVMVNTEYYKSKGVWHKAVYCQACILENIVSPYLDDDDEPSNPMEIQSSFVSRDGSRFGLIEAMKDPQDEINKRGSKALHILNSNQTLGEKGAVEDVNKAKKEKAKPDGHIEVNPGALTNGRFQFVDQSYEMAAHLQLLQEAKREIDEISLDASVSASASGRSRELDQQNQLQSVGRIFDRHRGWKRRIYRQIWNRIKQYWDEEKWVRVTDDENATKFVGINEQITLGMLIQEHAEQTGEPVPPEFANDPRLNQVVEVRNNVKQLGMDIILDEAPNYVNLMHEVFATVMDGVARSGQALPIETIIELMPALPNKRKVLDTLKGDEQAQAAQAELAQQQQQVQDTLTQLQVAREQMEIEKLDAETGKIEAETVDEMASAQQRLQPRQVSAG